MSKNDFIDADIYYYYMGYSSEGEFVLSGPVVGIIHDIRYVDDNVFADVLVYGPQVQTDCHTFLKNVPFMGLAHCGAVPDSMAHFWTWPPGQEMSFDDLSDIPRCRFSKICSLLAP